MKSLMFSRVRLHIMKNVFATPLFVIRRNFMMGAALIALARLSFSQEPWPTVAFPDYVRAFNLGSGAITVNGMPMRMQGFVSAGGREQLVRWFRRSLGDPVVENQIGNKLILGKAKEEYFITVQLEPAERGTRGLVAVTHLKAARDNRIETKDSVDRMLARLPAGSQLLSQMVSQDGGKTARHLVIANNHSESLNRDRVSALMQEDGLSPERHPSPGNGTAVDIPGETGNSKTLFFKGLNKEAVAVITRGEAGRTTIVLNTITSMERFK
jgi:hypothetical protein